MVTAEALYLNKPVVSFDCGGVKEIVNEANGIIVKCNNVDSISDAMVKVMNKEFAFNTSFLKDTVEKFDIKYQQERWKQIIDKVFSRT